MSVVQMLVLQLNKKQKKLRFVLFCMMAVFVDLGVCLQIKSEQNIENKILQLDDKEKLCNK